MIEQLHLLQGIIERGLLFSIVVAAVYVASRIIRFDNLSIEGAFGLGGALTALLISWNIHPWIALAGAVGGGGITGIVTGLLTTKIKLNPLISGIVMTSGLFSLTLATAGSNRILNENSTIFTSLSFLVAPYQQILLLTILCGAVTFVLQWLLATEVGYLLRAVGDTPQMVTNVGKDADRYTILGLTISNMLAAFSGGLFVQYAGYFSIWASVGILIIGIAGMILAELFSKNGGIALVIGSLAYQAIITLTFELQLNQDWNKLITAFLIVLLIAIKQLLHKK